MRTRTLLVVFILSLVSTLAAADELLVAAASDLHFALQNIASRFEQQTGNKVRVSFGSSGNFFNLIENGAPFDLFFSADIGYARRLEASGRGEPGSLYEYASGRLVLWVPQNSPMDLNRGLNVLQDPRVRRIAVANPRHAPYGRAAVAALQSANLYARLREKLVIGENISQTAEFVQTGNADVGLVALSLALSPTMKPRGRFVEVPASSYPAIRQATILLKSSRNKVLARQFLNYVKSPESSSVLRQYGFVVPSSVK